MSTVLNSAGMLVATRRGRMMRPRRLVLRGGAAERLGDPQVRAADLGQ